MNYIEQLFGISPDAGSGFTEMTIAIALLAACGLALGLRGYFKRRASA